MHVLGVGDPTIDWSSFAPQSDTKSVLIRHDGLVQTIGKVTERIYLIKIDGRYALERMQCVDTDLLGTFSHMTTVDHDTFAPIWHWDDIGGQTVEVDYAATGVSGTIELGDGTTTAVDMPILEPVFDLYSVELILRLLPLSDGYTATLPVFHPGLQQFLSVRISVLSREFAYAGDESMEEAWRVEARFGTAMRPYLYWIGVHSQLLLKQESTTESGVVLQFSR